MIADVFELLIQDSDFAKLDCKPLETAFGHTEELYVFVDGVNIGKRLPVQPYHQVFMRSINYDIVLDIKELFKLDLSMMFLKKLISRLSPALLIYEEDCDQHRFHSFTNTEYEIDDLLDDDLKSKIQTVKAFTLEIGKAVHNDVY